MQAKVLGTTGRLHDNFAAQVYQALNIVLADTAEQSLELNMILAAVREHCKIVICLGRAEQPQTIEAYRRLSGKANYDSTASNDLSKIMASDRPNKYFAKMTKALLKEANRRINTKEAEYHLQLKFNRWGWDQGGASHLILRMQHIPDKVISTTIRIHCLKMILYQKVKDYYKESVEIKQGLGAEWIRSKYAPPKMTTPPHVKDA